MNKMPAGAISSEAEIISLIERAKKGERINLYWASQERVEGVNGSYGLKTTTSLRQHCSHPNWLTFDDIGLHVAIVPGHHMADYVFSNYWYALAWRHMSLKSKGITHEHC